MVDHIRVQGCTNFVEFLITNFNVIFVYKSLRKSVLRSKFYFFIFFFLYINEFTELNLCISIFLSKNKIKLTELHLMLCEVIP